MITGVHTMFYTSEADEMRAFFRDVMKLPFTDVGGGWLIFDLPDAELGVHPSDDRPTAQPGIHNISFYCDDVHKTKAEFESKGVEFTMDITDYGYGLVTRFKMPGGVEADLYQPQYKRDSQK